MEDALSKGQIAIGGGAPVYLSAVLESVTEFVLQLAAQRDGGGGGGLDEDDDDDDDDDDERMGVPDAPDTPPLTERKRKRMGVESEREEVDQTVQKRKRTVIRGSALERAFRESQDLLTLAQATVASSSSSSSSSTTTTTTAAPSTPSTPSAPSPVRPRKPSASSSSELPFNMDALHGASVFLDGNVRAGKTELAVALVEAAQQAVLVDEALDPKLVHEFYTQPMRDNLALTFHSYLGTTFFDRARQMGALAELDGTRMCVCDRSALSVMSLALQSYGKGLLKSADISTYMSLHRHLGDMRTSALHALRGLGDASKRRPSFTVLLDCEPDTAATEMLRAHPKHQLPEGFVQGLDDFIFDLCVQQAWQQRYKDSEATAREGGLLVLHWEKPASAFYVLRVLAGLCSGESALPSADIAPSLPPELEASASWEHGVYRTAQEIEAAYDRIQRGLTLPSSAQPHVYVSGSLWSCAPQRNALKRVVMRHFAFLQRVIFFGELTSEHPLANVKM